MNIVNFIDDLVEVKLLGNFGENKSFLVSKDDYSLIMDYKWYLNSNGYPYTFGKGSINFGKRGKTLHKFLLISCFECFRKN